MTLTLHQVTCSLHEWRQTIHCLGQVSQVRAHQDDRVALIRKWRHDRSRELGVLTHHAVADHANLLDVLVGQLDRTGTTSTAAFTTSVWPVGTWASRATWSFGTGTARTTWSLPLPGRASRPLWCRLLCWSGDWCRSRRGTWTRWTHHVLKHRHRILLPSSCSWLAHILHHLAHHIVHLPWLAHALHNRVDLVHIRHLEARGKPWDARWHLWLTLWRRCGCATSSGAGCVRHCHHVDRQIILIDYQNRNRVRIETVLC